MRKNVNERFSFGELVLFMRCDGDELMFIVIGDFTDKFSFYNYKKTINFLGIKKEKRANKIKQILHEMESLSHRNSSAFIENEFYCMEENVI